MTDAPDPIITRPLPPEDVLTAALGAEGTRATLLRVALDLFGRKGYDATSTRDIAAAAGVNIAGIAYHFGGKAGLQAACGEAIGAIVSRHFPVDMPPAVTAALDPDAAAALFERVVADFARFLLARPEAEAIARFMVREQMDPSPVFERLYETLIGPRHRRLCEL